MFPVGTDARLGPRPDLTIAALRDLGLPPETIARYLKIDRHLVQTLDTAGPDEICPPDRLRTASDH